MNLISREADDEKKRGRDVSDLRSGWLGAVLLSNHKIYAQQIVRLAAFFAFVVSLACFCISIIVAY